MVLLLLVLLSSNQNCFICIVVEVVSLLSVMSVMPHDLWGTKNYIVCVVCVICVYIEYIVGSVCVCIAALSVTVFSFESVLQWSSHVLVVKVKVRVTFVLVLVLSNDNHYCCRCLRRCLRCLRWLLLLLPAAQSVIVNCIFVAQYRQYFDGNSDPQKKYLTRSADPQCISRKGSIHYITVYMFLMGTHCFI